MQPLLSLHAEPSLTGGFVHIPVDGSQVPTVWHASRAVHVTPTQGFGIVSELSLGGASGVRSGGTSDGGEVSKTSPGGGVLSNTSRGGGVLSKTSAGGDVRSRASASVGASATSPPSFPPAGPELPHPTTTTHPNTHEPNQRLFTVSEASRKTIRTQNARWRAPFRVADGPLSSGPRPDTTRPV